MVCILMRFNEFYMVVWRFSMYSFVEMHFLKVILTTFTLVWSAKFPNEWNKIWLWARKQTFHRSVSCSSAGCAGLGLLVPPCAHFIITSCLVCSTDVVVDWGWLWCDCVNNNENDNVLCDVFLFNTMFSSISYPARVQQVINWCLALAQNWLTLSILSIIIKPCWRGHQPDQSNLKIR